MSFLYWLETSALGDWVATSLWGYPIMLAAHSVGLAIIVGILFVLNLRLIGFFPKIDPRLLRPLIKLAWAGFIVNLISGFMLFAAQAPYFITHPAFIIKLIAIFLAIINAALLQNLLKENVEKDKFSKGKYLAISSLVLWSTAIIAGRMIAYI